MSKYWFNQTAGVCEPFTYSGCGANDNNFESLESCQESCLDKGDTLLLRLLRK
jgi:hypothetical protein